MSSTPSLITPEARAAISVLRAVVVSRKYPANVKEISKDYKALEGNLLNYKKFGFSTIEEFLTASGEFTVNKINGETCISARPSKESAHISEMIRKQKSRKTKKKSSPVFRQPQRTDQSWNKSSYSSVYQNLPQASSTRQNNRLSSRSRNKRSADTNRVSGDTNNNRNQNNRNSQNKAQQQQQSNKMQNVTSQVSNRISNNQQQLKQQSMRQSGLNSAVANAGTASAVGEKKSLSTKQPRAILGQTNGNKQLDTKHQSNNILQNRLQNFSPQQQQNTFKSKGQNKQNDINNVTQSYVPKAPTPLSKRLNIIGNSVLMNQEKELNAQPPPPQSSQLINAAKTETVSNLHPTQQPTLSYSMPSTLSTRLSRVSIQDRLKLNQAPAVLNGTMMNKSGSVSPGDSPSSVLSNNISVINKETNKTKEIERRPILPINFEFNPNLDPITSLTQYCVVKKYVKPEYKFLKPKFSKKFQCRVLVNGSIYSTYPDEYVTQDDAQVACAVLAIEQFKIFEAKKNFPVCTDADPELSLKIYQELQNHPHGIFCKNIPDMFEKAFNQSLPEHWLAIVQSSKQFLLESTASDQLIVFANTENSESSAASTTSETDFIVLDKITLPWDAKYWNLYVTSCISTIEIWARIVGEEYSDALDSLMNDIDVYMLTDKTRPTSISVGQIYLVCVSECWHRVRVEDMDKAAGKCLCFFIDFGDEEWCAMDLLFICEMKFLRLPPQAIPFSLFGLEDFAENPNAKRHLDEMLIGMPLVGEILTKKDAFESTNGSNDDFNAKIQVVLYNTSSVEDVNLNPLIMNKICDDTPPPELKRNGVTNVNITHVNSSGEIFLQVRHLGLLYVQKLINQLVESKFKEEQYKVKPSDIKKLNLYLVRDTEDNRWYRGALADGDHNPNDTQLNIFYVDYGKIKLTDIKNIFRLESLSAALSKFPKQAIKAKLYNIPPINDTIIARIRGLLPPDDPAIVKLAVHAIVPQIIVYRRFEANQGLFNVNEVIQIEYELESQSEAIIEIGRQSPVLAGRENSSSPVVGQSSTSDLSINTRGISLKSPITVLNSPQKGELPKISENTEIPEKGKVFDVYVAMASNPSNFIVQPYNHGPQLISMMTELQEYCRNNDDFIPSDMVEVGQAYAALNTDDYYHRVIVENILDSSMIHVYYCDFGDIAVLGNDKLKTLPTKFRVLPKQAISAKLYGVKPKHGDWTLEDCIRFKELTVGKMYASIIMDVTSDSFSPKSEILELDLIDVDTDEDIYIRKTLIDENRALPA